MKPTTEKKTEWRVIAIAIVMFIFGFIVAWDIFT